jgi:hypothetical protein
MFEGIGVGKIKARPGPWYTIDIRLILAAKYQFFW